MSRFSSVLCVALLVLILMCFHVKAQDQPSVAKVVPILSSKYKYMKEVKESISTLQLEIQVLNADPSAISNHEDLISMKKESIQEMERLQSILESEIRAMERIVLRDGSLKTCLDISKAFKAAADDGKNITSGYYPLVDRDYIKKTYCSFEVSSPITTTTTTTQILSVNNVQITKPTIATVTSVNGMSVVEPSKDSAYSDLKKLYQPNMATIKGLREERGVISKKIASSDWDASFFSKEFIDENTPYQGISFKAGQNNLLLAVGLSMKDIGSTLNDMTYSIYLSNNQAYYVYEKGANVGTFGRYDEGDEFRIAVCMVNMVCYYYNGKVFYTSRINVQYPLYLDSSFLNNGARILDLYFIEPLNADPKFIESGQAIYFKNVQGCLTSAGYVKKIYSTVNSFDSGVSSTLRFGDSFTSTTFTSEERAKSALVGGFSFKVGESLQNAVIGLANEDNTFEPSDIKFGIQLHPSGFVHIYEKGETFGPLQSYFKGDVFSIQLIKEEISANLYNNRVIYIHNSQPFYLSRKTATLPMIVDVSMANQYSCAYDFAWTERFDLRDGKIAENEPVYFPFLRGLSYRDGVMNKILRVDGFNAFASSNFTITPKSDAKGFSFKVNQNNFAIAVGLSSKDTDSLRNIEFGVYLKGDNTISVMDNSNSIDNMGTYKKGDRFSIFVTSEGKVGCIQNGEEFFTSSSVVQFPLKIVTTFEKIEGSISDIMYVSESGVLEEAPQTIKPGNPVFWKHVHGMKSKPGYQRKTLLTEGWNAGSFSYHAITENSLIGGITFKPNSFDKNIIMGLSSAKSHTNYVAIDMAVYLSGNQYYVYEKGSNVGSFGQFDINDRFDIAISQDNTQIVFLYNGVIFYTNQAPPLPLHVDNSFYTSDSCLFDIMYTEKFAFNQSDASVGSPVYFKNVNGLDVSTPGKLIKTKSVNSWDTAFSTVGIQSPQSDSVNKQVYGIKFVIAGRKNSLIALSNIDTKNVNYEYAFKFSPPNAITIMERGSAVYSHNKGFELGDNFSIYLSSGVVTYSFNGVNIYSSKKAPTFPLGVGVAIYEPGLAFEKVSFATNENEAPSKLAPNQKVYWNYVTGCSVDPGFVYKHTDSNSIDAFATSSLYINTQSVVSNYKHLVGGVSFKATAVSSYLGLTDVVELSNINGLQYCIYLDSGNIYIFEKGQMKGAFHTYFKDDEFSIRITTNYEKTKQFVVYSHNGNVFYSSQNVDSFVLPAKLYVGTALQKTKSSFVDITWIPAYEPEEGSFVNVIPGTPISNFSNIIGMERIRKGSKDITIRRNRPSADAGFYTSRRYISEGSKVDGFSFKTLFNCFTIQIGFTINTDIKIGIQLASDRSFGIMDNGNYLGKSGDYSETDEFSLIALPTGKKNERTFVFLKNGMVFYADPKKVYMGPFGISANFLHAGASIVDLMYIDSSIVRSASNSNTLVKWESAALVECKEGQAFKSIGSESWNSGVISASEFLNDDEINGVSFIASQPSGQTLVVGLNNEPDGSYSFAGIDFALYLTYNEVRVYENNNVINIGPVVNFRRGDTFEIKVMNGSVYYVRNGTIFYTSKTAPKFPFKVQASFYSSASQITDVKWISKPANRISTPPQ